MSWMKTIIRARIIDDWIGVIIYIFHILEIILNFKHYIRVVKVG